MGIGTIAPEKGKKEKPKPAGKQIEPETKSKTSKRGTRQGKIRQVKTKKTENREHKGTEEGE